MKKTGKSKSDRFNKALERERAGEYDKALEIYSSLAETDPTYRPAILNLGALCSRMKKHDEALVWYKKAIALEEEFLVWFNIGSILYQMGDFKESVFALEKARRLNRGFTLTILVMGLAYSKLGKTTAASGCFSEVLALDSSNEVALTALAIIHYERRKYNLALHYADAALQKNHSSVRARKLRSKILLSFGRNDESAIDLKEIIKKDKAFLRFDSFVKAIPTKVFDDNKGTLDEKIVNLESRIEDAMPKDFIALSLCHLFNGEPDRAIDYLFKAKI